MELGPRDIENGVMTVFRRDTLEKSETPLDGAAESVKTLLGKIGETLYEKAKARMDGRIVTAKTLDELLDGVNGGNFVRAGWCGCRACEDKVKEYAQATARVMAKENTEETCVTCGKPSVHTVFFARAY